MRDWFESLEARERLFVGGGAVVVAIALLWGSLQAVYVVHYSRKYFHLLDQLQGLRTPRGRGIELLQLAQHPSRRLLGVAGAISERYERRPVSRDQKGVFVGAAPFLGPGAGVALEPRGLTRHRKAC